MKRALSDGEGEDPELAAFAEQCWRSGATPNPPSPPTFDNRPPAPINTDSMRDINPDTINDIPKHKIDNANRVHAVMGVCGEFYEQQVSPFLSRSGVGIVAVPFPAAPLPGAPPPRFETHH